MDIKVLFDDSAREGLYEGVKQITRAVASTLGPKGHTVIIDKGYGIPHVTKDGVTVARAFDTDDTVARMGATLVKMAAAKTCDEAGDGTTTATILTEALIRLGMEKMHLVKNPQQFKRGIERACEEAVDFINNLKHEIDPTDFTRLEQIATISANGDVEIGKVITGAIQQVGNDGIITVEEGDNSSEITVDITTGFQWSKGLVNPYFVTDPERIECVLDNPYVLILGQKANYPQEILPVVQTVYTAKRSLLIVAPDASNDVIKFLVTNIAKENGLKACFVKAPGYGQVQKDMLEDLAVKMGGKVVGGESAQTIEQLGTDWLGECERAVVTSNQTTLVGGAGTEEEIQTRVKAIKNQIDDTSNTFDKEKYRERISKLTGGAAVIHVGATSEVEMKERKDRVDDAIAATRAAIDEGYVPGGGMMPYQAAQYLTGWTPNTTEDERVGIEVVIGALRAPFRQLCMNAGVNPDKYEAVIETKIGSEWRKGIDFSSMCIVDLFEIGVIDPVKVTRLALQNAVSVAIQFLNTSCVMAEPPKDKKS